MHAIMKSKNEFQLFNPWKKMDKTPKLQKILWDKKQGVKVKIYVLIERKYFKWDNKRR